jgi:hypothetical protein
MILVNFDKSSDSSDIFFSNSDMSTGTRNIFYSIFNEQKMGGF